MKSNTMPKPTVEYSVNLAGHKSDFNIEVYSRPVGSANEWCKTALFSTYSDAVDFIAAKNGVLVKRHMEV